MDEHDLCALRDGKAEEDVRVLVDERGSIVDFVVDDKVEVFLGRVFRHLGECEILRHDRVGTDLRVR